MKRLLFFCMVMSAFSICPENLAGLSISASPNSSALSLADIPALELPDLQDDEDQELLDSTVAVEPPLYLRILMKVGSETAAQVIYLQRAIVARCKAVAKWWAGS